MKSENTETAFPMKTLVCMLQAENVILKLLKLIWKYLIAKLLIHVQFEKLKGAKKPQKTNFVEKQE